MATDPFEQLIDILCRFGSDQEGEIVNAARIADKRLKQLGMTWREFWTPPEATATANVNVGGAAPNRPPPPPPPPSGQPQPQPRRYRPSGGSARAHFMATHYVAGDHRRVAAALMAGHMSVCRNQKEIDFVNDMAAMPAPHLTMRQYQWLFEIAARAGVSFRVNP